LVTPSNFAQGRRDLVGLPENGQVHEHVSSHRKGRPMRSLCWLGILGALASSAVAAQDYPARAVRVIVPFPAGGPTDVLIRIYGQRLSERWSRPVVVENRAGATGTIATEAVVRAPPDGYTLLFTVDLPIVMAPALRKVRYDPQRDLVPVAAIAKTENLLVANPATGIRSLGELVAAAKAKPGSLTFASGGNASPGHLCGEMLKSQAHIELTHVPYTGASLAMNAVLAGDVTIFCGPLAQGMVYVRSGKLNALGVTGIAASALLPEVGPLAATFPGLVISNWYALFAPLSTPVAVTGFLNEAIRAVYSDKDLQQKLAGMGIEPAFLSPRELSQLIAADTIKWTHFIKAAHIAAD
jgi:tripartite-type tricarboxylate transporter receptor subunit TctC